MTPPENPTSTGSPTIACAPVDAFMAFGVPGIDNGGGGGGKFC